MKSIQILALIIFCQSTLTFGQETILYDSLGRLKYDLQFQLNSYDHGDILIFEKNILPLIYNALVYPGDVVMHGISGTVIIELNYSKLSDSLEINVLKEPPDNLGELAVSSIISVSDRLIKQMNTLLNHDQLTIIIPIEYQLIDDTFFEDLTKYNKVVFRRPQAPWWK